MFLAIEANIHSAKEFVVSLDKDAKAFLPDFILISNTRFIVGFNGHLGYKAEKKYIVYADIVYKYLKTEESVNFDFSQISGISDVEVRKCLNI